MRNVFCGVKQNADYLKILSNDRCSLLPQLKKIQQCSIRPCYTQWIALSWQPVSRKAPVKAGRCYSSFLASESGIAKEADPTIPSQRLRRMRPAAII